MTSQDAKVVLLLLLLIGFVFAGSGCGAEKSMAQSTEGGSCGCDGECAPTPEPPGDDDEELPEPDENKSYNTVEIDEYGEGLFHHRVYSPTDRVFVGSRTFKEGSRFGTFFEAYKDGKPKLVGAYYNDKKSGIWLEFDEDGKLLSRKMYEDGEEVALAVENSQG